MKGAGGVNPEPSGEYYDSLLKVMNPSAKRPLPMAGSP